MGQVTSGGGVSGPLLFSNVLDTNALGFYYGPGASEAGWTWPKGVAYLAHLDTIIFDNAFLISGTLGSFTNDLEQCFWQLSDNKCDIVLTCSGSFTGT